MNAQGVSITLDISGDVSHLNALVAAKGTPAGHSIALSDAIEQQAKVIKQKLILQGKILEGMTVPESPMQRIMKTATEAS